MKGPRSGLGTTAWRAAAAFFQGLGAAGLDGLPLVRLRALLSSRARNKTSHNKKQLGKWPRGPVICDLCDCYLFVTINSWRGVPPPSETLPGETTELGLATGAEAAAISQLGLSPLSLYPKRDGRFHRFSVGTFLNTEAQIDSSRLCHFAEMREKLHNPPTLTWQAASGTQTRKQQKSACL